MTKRFKLLTAFLMIAGAIFFAGCKGGGGSSSTGGTYFTHEELAEEFVYRLIVDLGYDVELVKTNTYQYDYIVVYDYDYDTYDAYYIGNYNPGESLSNYVYNYDGYFYFDLDYIGGNDYQDPLSGIVFDKGGSVQRDLMKVAAHQQFDFIKVAGKKIAQKFDVPEGVGQKMAKAALQVAGAKKRGVGAAFYDQLMQENTGSSITAWQDALTANDGSAEPLFAKAGQKFGGLSAADAKGYMLNLFLK